MYKWFISFLPNLFQRKLNIKFLLASSKTLTSSNNCPESRIKILFRISFAVKVDFLLCTFHGRHSRKFLRSLAAFGTTF
jgi:hypothetical protein